MAYKINFFGWCAQPGHDKVWGYVTVGDDQLYNFWGRRGGRFAFQKHEARYQEAFELMRKAEEKCRPGRKSGSYVAVEVEDIENIVPGFFDEFEKQLTLAKLFDNFRGLKAEES